LSDRSASGLRASVALARHEVRLLGRDPLPLGLLFLIPLLVMVVFQPALRLALLAQGYTEANGAEQAVPGTVVMFSLFLTGFVGLVFFREHGWGTWDRLRMTTGPAALVAGKLLPVALVGAAQLAWLFGAGWFVLDLRVRGSLAALALVCLALLAAVLAMGLSLVGWLKTLQQLNAVANLQAVVLSGVGGALVPPWLLPSWLQAVGPATPAYWAMRGFRAVLLDGGGIASVLLPCAVLGGFAALFSVLFALGFSAEESKSVWA
jgi:ABC-2 type transport system permease protein